MVKLPNYERKIRGERREMRSVVKGMIIAFFVTFGIISTVFSLVDRPS